MYSQIIFKRRLKNCVDSFSFSLQKYPVHDLNPTCNSNNPNLTIVFFHGIAFGTNDEWKERVHMLARKVATRRLEQQCSNFVIVL
jgi:hypothetical protein